MRAGGGCQPLRGSETSDGSDVRCQIIAPASPPIHPAAGPQLFFENPVIVINLRDLSTPRSCSDFADRVMRHASTARDDDIGEVSDRAVKPLVVSLPFSKGDVCEADRGILMGLRLSDDRR